MVSWAAAHIKSAGWDYGEDCTNFMSMITKKTSNNYAWYKNRLGNYVYVPIGIYIADHGQ